MLGDAIKVSPRIDPAQYNTTNTTFKSYFPKGVWTDLNNWSSSINASEGGAYFDLDAKDGQTNIHLKAGKIIPHQYGKTVARSTRDWESNYTQLVINVDDSEYAEGYMLIDDGTSQDQFADNKYTFWKIRYAE